MKTSINTSTRSTTSMMVISLFAFGCAVIGGTAKAAEPEQLNAAAYNAPEASRVLANDQSAANATLTYIVGFSDLDVSKVRGVKLLYARLHYAASVLCESAATWGKKEGRVCVSRAVDDAVARINRPLLSEYYQLRSKGNKAGLVQLAKAN
jgi:UrcA family protein